MLEDCEFDRVLSEALADYYAETPDWQGILSLKYRWRFKRMLANPFEYVKHWQERPLLKLRRYTLTAMVLFAIAGGVLFGVPQLRVVATNLFTEWHEGYNSYHFAFYALKDEKLILPKIEITYIPEGYELDYFDINGAKTHAVWRYINTDGKILTIYADVNDANFKMYYDNEYHKQQRIALSNGRQAIFLVRDKENRRNSLLWTEFDDNIALSINGDLSAKELIKIANDILIK